MSKSVSAKAVHTLTARPLPEYVLIDPEYVLNKVVVIHRHGDRAQISRVLGTAFPENEDLAAKWETLLPTVATNRALLFASNPDDTIEETEDGFVDAEKTLYSGWDHINIPYAQLTQVGAEELIMVGKELRDRYREPLGLPDTIDAAANTIFCRSTNMCRTKQSIRSLLVGLFDVPVPTATSRVAAGDAELHGASSPVTREQLKHLPKILSRERLRETIYPNADGACAAMINRRSVVFPADALETNIPDYAAFEARIKPMFGFDQDNHTKVNWLQVKEVLTCHASHNISMIQEVTGHTDADIDKATEITGWTWGALYKDDILNRLAIGRFLWDMLEDLSAATATVDNPFARVLATHRDKTNSSSSNSIGSTGSSSTSSDIEAEAEAEAEPTPVNKKMLLYSGHDSTLVPVLSALGIYNDTWPPYASFLTLEFATETASQQQFVRALYNNQQLHMLGHEESYWCPLEIFLTRMQQLACSPQVYREECDKPSDTGAQVDAELAKEIQVEISATVDAAVSGVAPPASNLNVNVESV